MNWKEICGIPMLSGIQEDVLRSFAENKLIYTRSYSKGATVHNQNEICNNLEIVLSGRLTAYSLAENGSVMTMFEFAKSDIIGANLLFGEKNVYPLNIYCTSGCQLLHIGKEAVSKLLYNYNFVMGFIKSLSSNSLGLNRKLNMIARKTLRENILDYLKQQSTLQNSSKIALPMSKKELADYLGVQRPSLFRELKKLEDEGRIKIENRFVTFL